VVADLRLFPSLAVVHLLLAPGTVTQPPSRPLQRRFTGGGLRDRGRARSLNPLLSIQAVVLHD